MQVVLNAAADGISGLRVPCRGHVRMQATKGRGGI